jgi:hypothetical protein
VSWSNVIRWYSSSIDYQTTQSKRRSSTTVNLFFSFLCSASDLIGQRTPQDIPRDQINPVDEWQYKQIGQTPPRQRLVSTEGQVLDHELFTPSSTPDQGLGPMVKPLHFPEYDQSVLSFQQTGLPSPPAWEYAEIENRLDEPVGDYPRFVPMQYSLLKDPYVYWDQQNRRNFGEILYANDQMTNVWSPGPLPSWKKFFGLYAGFIALFSGLAYISTVFPTESDMVKMVFFNSKGTQRFSI